MKEKTLIIIKLNAISHCSEIWAMIKNSGFIVQEVKKVKISLQESEYLLSIQTNFVPLTNFVFEDDCMIAILEKENAVKDLLKLIGEINPANAFHGSSSTKIAELEISFFYNEVNWFFKKLF